jgi:hypothetical protein
MPTGLAVDPCGERFCVLKNRKVIVQTTVLSDEREPRDKAASRRSDVLTMGYVIHSPLSGPGPQVERRRYRFDSVPPSDPAR